MLVAKETLGNPQRVSVSAQRTGKVAHVKTISNGCWTAVAPKRNSKTLRYDGQSSFSTRRAFDCQNQCRFEGVTTNLSSKFGHDAYMRHTRGMQLFYDAYMRHPH